MFCLVPKFVRHCFSALVVLTGIASVGCRPPQNIAEFPMQISEQNPAPLTVPEPKQDIAPILLALEATSGSVERDAQGTIIGIDFVQERASATDETLKLALALPNLKKLRLSGSMISAETFLLLKTQVNIEELFLQDLTIGNEEFISVVTAFPHLRRLTLRRLSNISDAGIIPLFRFSALRQIALIEMPITGTALHAIGEATMLDAFDVRNCDQLVPDDYKHILRLRQLIDLKIGGFTVNDPCLEIVALIPALKALTLDDSLVSAKGFEQFVTDSLSADTLETLVLNRNMALADDALVAVGNFPRLQRLILGEAMTTGTFLTRLADDEQKRPPFNDLALRKMFLTEEAIASLKRYPELQGVQISGSTLSRQGIETLFSLARLERLDLRGCFFDEDAQRFLRELGAIESLESFRY